MSGFVLKITIEKHTYLPGETIIGDVRIVNGRKVTHIKGLILKCQGYAHVHFKDCVKSLETEVDFDGKPCNKNSWDSSENYVNFFVPLISTHGQDRVLCPREEFKYQFNFPLPTKLPASFEATHGHVQYLLTATVKRTFFKRDVKVRRPFLVSTVCDHNHDLSAKIPVTCSGRKTLGLLGWKPGLVSVSAWLDRKLYNPGEIIRLNCWVDNGSRLKLNACSASLIQAATFYGGGEREISKRILDRQIEFRRIGINETFSFSLVVPYVTPTRGIEACQIMKIEYYIMIKVKTPTLYPDVKLHAEVLIANVPVTDVNPVVENSEPSINETANTLRPVSTAVKNDDGLPTYEECISQTQATSNSSED